MRHSAKNISDRFFADEDQTTYTDWCVENLRFNEPENRGPFTIAGRECWREFVDCGNDDRITDEVVVAGTQLGKTVSLMARRACRAARKSIRALWVMPSITVARNFSKTRFMPMLRASVGTKNLIPKNRHEFSYQEMRLGQSIIEFTGSNSPANLSSKPCSDVDQDETEKFDAKDTGEAKAGSLADERTANQACPKRTKTSTPKAMDGVIWNALEKTDFRRRLMPCPICNSEANKSGKHVILIWSKLYTIIPLTGNEAHVRWDDEARRADGSWDLERVEKSAAYLCPHCGGRILDAHKTWMDREGHWLPTKNCAPNFRGWHLPALYSISPERSVGKLAMRFLNDKRSLEGMQGFINSVLAEPYEAQDTLGKRVELITQRIDRVEVKDVWKPMLDIDCQQSTPAFYYAAGMWRDTECQIAEAGHFETFDEARIIQKAHKIDDVCVGVDSGYGALTDAEVYRNCARFGILHKPQDKKAIHLGWTPCKGMPGRKPWKDSASGVMLPYAIRNIDPYTGTKSAGIVDMGLFEFASDYFQDILDNFRRGVGAFKFSVSQDVNLGRLAPVYDASLPGTLIVPTPGDMFWRHMDAHHKILVQNRHNSFSRLVWVKRTERWPNHTLDCVIQQIARATCLRLFKPQMEDK